MIMMIEHIKRHIFSTKVALQTVIAKYACCKPVTRYIPNQWMGSWNNKSRANKRLCQQFRKKRDNQITSVHHNPQGIKQT